MRSEDLSKDLFPAQSIEANTMRHDMSEKYYILKLDSYEGEGSSLTVWTACMSF